METAVSEPVYLSFDRPPLGMVKEMVGYFEGEWLRLSGASQAWLTAQGFEPQHAMHVVCAVVGHKYPQAWTEHGDLNLDVLPAPLPERINSCVDVLEWEITALIAQSKISNLVRWWSWLGNVWR